MKHELFPCVGGKSALYLTAALAALAAEGKDFSREELNAMLDRLAATPQPKTRIGPIATCYVVMPPRQRDFEYVCKKCGAHTNYPRTTRPIEDTLARLRDGAASLKALGLDIVLDESFLCSSCHTSKEIKNPYRGKIVAKPTSEIEAERFLWQIGDEVMIKSYFWSFSEISPLHPEYWINAKYISDDGVVTGDKVNIRWRPDDRNDRTICGRAYAGAKLSRLPAKPGDPEDWVRIEKPEDGAVNVKMWGPKDTVRTKCIGELEYGEMEEASIVRYGRIAWVINGKRTRAEVEDIDLLKAFLTGGMTITGRCDEKIPITRKLGRLRELLGVESGLERLAPASDTDPTMDIEVEVDI